MSPRERLFVREYLVDLNASQAAVRAGYSRAWGSRLLKKPGIRAAVDAALAERERLAEIDAEYVLKRLYEEAEADLADIYREDGTLRPVHEWPPVWRRGLVSGLETVEAGDGTAVTKIKLSERLRRLELIGKHVRVRAWEQPQQQVNQTNTVNVLQVITGVPRGEREEEQGVVIDQSAGAGVD